MPTFWRLKNSFVEHLPVSNRSRFFPLKTEKAALPDGPLAQFFRLWRGAGMRPPRAIKSALDSGCTGITGALPRRPPISIRSPTVLPGAGRSRTRVRRTGLCRACRRGLFRDRDCVILISEKLVVVIIRTGHFFQFIQKSHSGPPFTCRRLPCRCTDLCGVCRDGAQCREYSRAPKIDEPTRTMFAPAEMASSKSPLIPMDRKSIKTLSYFFLPMSTKSSCIFAKYA